MKKFLLCVSVLLCTLALTVGTAAKELPFVADWADLLSDEEESALNAFLEEISEEAGANIIVAAVDSLEGTDAQTYADDLYDAGLTYMGLMDGTEDGALFLVAIQERQWAISTTGTGITVLNEPALDSMEDILVPYLSEGAYYLAFQTFGELCGTYWDADPYGDENYDPFYDDYYSSDRETVRFEPKWIFISLIAGFLIALIPMSILKSQLNTVHMQSGAASYQKQDSVQITDSKDLFLYRNVTKKPIPRDNTSRSGGSRSGGSVHIGSSGRSHGGRSGGF
ncbi:MAG: TPM domain-containing protein [Clostridia bacterium]|nr:TPM domain-containing protein [Clostridia bacterium]